MLEGFLSGYYPEELTGKQKLEARIKDNILDLVLDRNLSFTRTARKRQTTIIVQNREGGIRRFNFEGRNYISFPSSLEKEFEGLSEYDANIKMQSILKLATVDNVWKQKEDGCEIINNDDYVDSLLDSYSEIAGNTLDEFDSISIEDEDGDKTIRTDLFEPYELIAKSKDEDDLKEDIEESEKDSTAMNITEKGSESKSSGSANIADLEFKRENEDSVYEWSDTQLNIDGSIPSDVKKDAFWSSKSCISNKREIELKKMADKICKSFKGRISKKKVITPSKRLTSKALCADMSEKIYQNKKGENGKHLSLNLVVDMSGSMDGTPVRNAVEMVYIFNEIAHRGYLTGSVLWSESSSSTISNFPMPRKFIKNMNATGGGEGLGRNMQKFLPQLKSVDTNICMTDGSLTDEPILKTLYEKERIQILGVYVNKDAKDLNEYTGSLNRWFTKSLVRRTMEELTEKLVAYGLRKKSFK